MASTVDAKLLRQTKFPPEFNQKVDMKKVNVEVMKKWIASRISQVLGNEDDVVTELCFNLLEDSRFPDIKALQISLTGFLDKDTPKFCKELWNLCLSAQGNPQGVPKELLEAKKLELLQEKNDAERAAEEARQRKEQESIREREVDMFRQQERAERGRGRGGGGRGGRSFDPRRTRDSASPLPHRRRSLERGPPPRREVDTYIPSGRDGRRPVRKERSLTRSPTRSPSRSPPLSSPDSHRHRHRHRLRSRSRSQRRPFRSRRSPSLSLSPPRRGLGRHRRRSISRGDRSRSDSYSVSSRSRSPRRRRKVSTSPSPSISPSPPPRRRPRKRRSPSFSPSRSSSRDRPRRRGGKDRRSRRSDSFHSQDDRRGSRADVVKGPTTRDERRLSRSGDRHGHPRQHTGSRSRSGSRSRGNQRERRRRRSLERWAPPARKRRNTSSVTSPDDKRQKIADASPDEVRSEQPQTRNHADEDMMVKEDDKEVGGN
ncbi:hypothetical protein GJ744_006094 [Endocarpon pusillum]|uniref:PWI domain-containing protein n=1 Tax=Endocarpon pusillum TaxID=364733 RepID=A0A8H7AKC1_9EURO|nr:hypothetical protein GJ744_006094 [Endocarpon pusillum]